MFDNLIYVPVHAGVQFDYLISIFTRSDFIQGMQI